MNPTPSLDLPRSQAGSSSQHLLTTLLGDYWAGRTEHLPSAALVALLGEFEQMAAPRSVRTVRRGPDVPGSLPAIRVRQIVERYSPDLAELIKYNTTGDLRELRR